VSPWISTHPLGGCYSHLLGTHRPQSPGFNHTPYRRSWEFRQQDHTAIGMYKELNPITRLQPKMFTDGFRDGGLSLDRDCRFHIPPLHILKCNTALPGCQAGQPNPEWCGQLGRCRFCKHARSLHAVAARDDRPTLQCSLPASQERHTARTPLGRRARCSLVIQGQTTVGMSVVPYREFSSTQIACLGRADSIPNFRVARHPGTIPEKRRSLACESHFLPSFCGRANHQPSFAFKV